MLNFNKKINEINYCIFDVETTGLNYKEDQMIEIAAIKCDYLGNVIATFEEKIKLYKKEEIPIEIIELTKITNEDLMDGKEIKEVIIDFLEFIDETILVAQNTDFDISFLIQTTLEELNTIITPVNLDLINLSKNLFPQKGSYKLKELVNYYQVDFDQQKHHRALYDCEITMACFVKALTFYKECSLKDLLSLNKTKLATEKQFNYLNSLIEKNDINFIDNQLLTIKSCSIIIDYLKEL